MKAMNSLVIGAILLTGLVAAQGCASASHYRAHRDSASLFKVLTRQIHNGDTIAEVERLLGAGGPATLDRAKRIHTFYMTRHPKSYPDGYMDTDELIVYSADGWSHVLQFRNGVLINHNLGFYGRSLQRGELISM